jgi:RHS repeat-associated protein
MQHCWVYPTYDAAGRLGEVKKSGVTYTTAITDTVGRLQSLSRANGATTAYTYDGADRITQLRTTVGGNTRANFIYNLNRGSQATIVTETLGLNTRTVDYWYDGLNRLTTAREAPGDKYEYTYDLVGNRTQVKVNAVVIETRSYDAADQVTNTGWQYDGAGNLLQDGNNTYTYDALKRLVQADRVGQQYIYTYNGDNVLEKEQRTTGPAWTITYYTLDNAGDGGTGLPERLGARIHQGTVSWYVRGWGQELSREDFPGKGSTATWYLPDRLGSVRGTMDNAGSLSNTYNYDPFGTPEGGSAPQDYGFAGEPQNSFLKQVYLRARWYNTQNGRFDTRDPIMGGASQPMSLHPYMYGYADPVNWVDRNGEYPVNPNDGYSPRTGTPPPPPQIGVPTIPPVRCASPLDPLCFNNYWGPGVSACAPARPRPTQPPAGYQPPVPLPRPSGPGPQPQPAPGPRPLPVPPPQPGPQPISPPRPAITPTPSRPNMRVQLQEQRGSNTIHHASVLLHDQTGNGVTTAQAIAALQQVRASPAIPRGQQNRANTALAQAIRWVQARL